MKNPSITTGVALGFLALAQCQAATFPDYGYQPPKDWSGSTFKLSQDYPKTVSADEVRTWERIDFRANPEEYLAAILEYCYDGNEPVDFVAQNNKVRSWYHAPWLHTGRNQREFVRGLTAERTSRPFELSESQKIASSNFAIGFYNEPGGYEIGRVWADVNGPKYDSVMFPEGTVTFKLLFTTATASDVGYLAGSPEWTADINRSATKSEVLNSRVRLLQMDIAVKDKRSMKGGWIFGTLHYDAAITASTPWRRMRPLALMWGDDPALTMGKYEAGERPRESWVNKSSPLVIYRNQPPTGIRPPSTLGWGGRANGPVDNPLSSCLSCHGTAQIPATSPMLPPRDSDIADQLRWFRNLGIGQPFDANSKTLDYSLQLGVGIQNYFASREQPSGELKALPTQVKTFEFSRNGE